MLKAAAGPTEAARSSVLLATKLHAPSWRSSLVARPRLVELFNLERAPKLTIVVAPPGSGKTTLLSSWLAAEGSGSRFAWLSLDREDSDPARFWTYFVEALRSVEPQLAEPVVTLLRVPGTDIRELCLPLLLNEVRELAEPVVLVLDDYHLVTSNEVHEAFAFLIEQLPPSLRIVLASRSDPPLPLPRIRVRGDLLEIRAEDLRFSFEETGELLNEALGLELEPAEVATLHKRAEGWAAGLYLAALSLGGRTDAAAVIEAFAGDDRHVVDYLWSEVLAGLGENLRTFLLKTSILDRLCGPLCDAVTGEEKSAAVLRQIEGSNLFLIPLDSKRQWYRYHHLFRGLLRHELSRGDAGLASDLHQRAAAWLQAEGAVADAIVHWTAAGAFEQAADLISLHWPEFLQQGQLATIVRWLDELPAATVEGDPRLCLTRAWLAVNLGRIDQIGGWLEGAHRATGAGEEITTLEAAAEGLRCIQRYMEGDVGNAIEAAREAWQLEPDERAPWRSVGCPVLGIALFWRGQAAEAEDTLERAVQRARPAGNNLAVIHAHSCLAAMSSEQGEVERTQQLADTALQLAKEFGLEEHWATTMAHVALGRVLELRGRLDEADAELARAVELSHRGVVRIEIAYALLAHAGIRHRLGDRAGARELVAQARTAVAECKDPGLLSALLERTERRLRLAPQPASPRVSDEEELTERELAVLRYFPTQLTLREIGSSLFVSVNTVKTHARGIYRKLGAANRAEAVARARELRLL